MISRISRIVETARGGLDPAGRPRPCRGSELRRRRPPARARLPRPRRRRDPRLAATLAAAEAFAERARGGSTARPPDERSGRFLRGSSPPGRAEAVAAGTLRLFPAVACAAGALLALKTIDAIQNPGSRSTLAEMARKARGVRSSTRRPPARRRRAKKKDEKPDAKADPKIDPSTAPAPRRCQLEGQPPLSAAEKSLLQRLGDRREQLDDRQRELEPARSC